jgi:serine/threonine protein kinase
MLGQTLGHYRIVAKIGAGGMGEVYRAHDEQLDRDVALKILPVGTLTDEAARKQFRKEALALAKLNHPNIETVHEFGSQDGTDFLVMELIIGSSLRDKLKAGPLPKDEVVRLGLQFAEGLSAAHEQGVIHRDLKPGNLMVTRDGRLKILDFGLAKLLQSPDVDATRSISEVTGTVSGTIPYMAPEQLRGEPVDARSDVYAAGATLYEVATGQRPFPQSHGPTLMGAILHETPAPARSINPHITPALAQILHKSLDKEPTRRYQSARELHVALEGVGAAREPVAVERRWTPTVAIVAELADAPS